MSQYKQNNSKSSSSKGDKPNTPIGGKSTSQTRSRTNNNTGMKDTSTPKKPSGKKVQYRYLMFRRKNYLKRRLDSMLVSYHLLYI